YNEKYVITRLLEAVCNLDYPSDKLEIQVLDDSTDECSVIIKQFVAEKKNSLNIQHIQRANREGYKAGALQYGLQIAEGEFIAIFDADFVPHPDYL
ncbi:MAG: glycosyltransferase, partial [Luteibaculum sp.]